MLKLVVVRLTPFLIAISKKIAKNPVVGRLIRVMSDFNGIMKPSIRIQYMYYILYRYTRKYPLRGYILGVLTHTTAWDRHWGGDETLKLVLVYFA